jgi:hypothetical protein
MFLEYDNAEATKYGIGLRDREIKGMWKWYALGVGDGKSNKLRKRREDLIH